MVEISKKDWKLYREKLADWQERYMEDLLIGYVKMLSLPGNASDHFWELEKRIQKDKKHPGVIMEVRKSDAYWDIAHLLNLKVITEKDLEGFSEDTLEAVKLIRNR